MPIAFSLVYQSTATPLLTETALRDVLATARQYNSAHHITGLLLVTNGRILQFLEGTEVAVRGLYACIERDPRHAAVTLLSAGPITQREFPDWAMGFAGALADLLITPGALDSARLEFLLGREHNFSDPSRAHIVAFLALG